MGQVNQSAEQKHIDRGGMYLRYVDNKDCRLPGFSESENVSEIRIRGHPANRSARFPGPIRYVCALKIRTGF